MQIVIEIPESIYDSIQSDQMISREQLDVLEKHICDGTPLPKGHGRLIDADQLQAEMKKDIRKAMSFVDLTDFVWLAPTIIEEEKNERTVRWRHERDKMD